MPHCWLAPANTAQADRTPFPCTPLPCASRPYTLSQRTEAQFLALKNGLDNGKVYLNIHTEGHSDGCEEGPGEEGARGRMRHNP